MRTISLSLVIFVAIVGCKKENKDAKPAANKAADAAVAKADPMKGGNYGGKAAAPLDTGSVKVVAAAADAGGGAGGGSGSAAVPPPSGPTASTASCEAAVKHVFDLMAKDPEMSGEMKTMKPDELQKQMAEGAKQCADKKTTQAEVDCVMATTDMAGLEKCDKEHKGSEGDSDGDEAKAEPAHMPAPGGGMSVDQALDQMDKFTTEICACKDKDCLTAVQTKMGELSSKVDQSQKPTEAQMARVQDITKRMTDCAMKIMAPATPPPAPPAK